MNREPTNADRADWAHEAMRRFADKTCDDGDAELRADPETLLCDLLCDLRHWADVYGVDYNTAAVRGLNHYEAERETWRDVYEQAAHEEDLGHFTMAAKLYERADDLRNN